MDIHLTHAQAAVVNESRKEIATHLLGVFQKNLNVLGGSTK